MVNQLPESINQPNYPTTMEELFGEIRSLFGQEIDQNQIMEYLLSEDVFSLIKANQERFKDELTPYILSQLMRSKVKESLGVSSESLTFYYIKQTAEELGDEVYDLVGIFIDSLKIPYGQFKEFIEVLNSGKIPNLRTLDLGGNLIQAGGAKELAGSPNLGQLKTLNLAGCNIGDEGLRAFIRDSPYFKKSLKII